MHRSGISLLALLACILPACSSRYAALKDERDDGLYAKNDEHACLCRELGACHSIDHKIVTRGVSGTQVHVMIHEIAPTETAAPPDAAPVVLIHGVFADHSSWRFITPLL